MKKIRTAAWLAVIALAAAWGGHWAQQEWAARQTEPASLVPAVKLTDLAGKTHQLTDYRGKLVLLNFWASWCAPCVHELPLLVKAQADYGARGFQVLGPALDDQPSIEGMVAKFGISYPVMGDYNEVDAAMKALGNNQGALPYSLLISPEGKVLQVVLGGLKEVELKTWIEQHLPQGFLG